MTELFRGILEAIPFLLTVTLELFSATLLPLSLGLGAPIPCAGLVGVCYWSYYRPDALDVPSILVIGIVWDLVSGIPLGISPLVLLLVRVAIQEFARRRIAGVLVYMWVVLPMLMLVATVVTASAAGVLLGSMPATKVVLFQSLATIGVYPLFHALFSQLLIRVPDLAR